jgi:allantoicase
LVIVAENGKDDRPDPASAKAFIMDSDTGLSYSPGVWREFALGLANTS